MNVTTLLICSIAGLVLGVAILRAGSRLDNGFIMGQAVFLILLSIGSLVFSVVNLHG